MKIKCSLKECQRDARHQIGFQVWALGHKKTTSKPITMLLGIACCDRCKHLVKIEHFISPEAKERIQGALRDAGKVPADFTTAELCFDPITDNRLRMGI